MYKNDIVNIDENLILYEKMRVYQRTWRQVLDALFLFFMSQGRSFDSLKGGLLMKKIFFTNATETPIISAVNDLNKLDIAINSPCGNIFLLTGNIINIKETVERIKAQDKEVYIHIDLIEGISKDIWGLEYLVKNVKPDGIITTKANLIKHSKNLGIFTIQRLFMLDSLSIESGIRSINITNPDAVEILPGIIPKIIKIIHKSTNVPIITGGLIMEKEDVIQNLNSGAIAISTSCEKVWYM